MPIRILSPEIANQIAAGEVVERPASAVKELVENSLDAGATEIRIEVREGGRSLIRIQDDGCGIPSEEVAIAFERHATSKLSTAEDLAHITTLGFRGEALASIASVAQVTLLSRTAGADAGLAVRMVQGHQVESKPQGMPPGTIVTVEHLFANVPARLKFLKQPATEAAHIQQVVSRYALAYPDRRFSLVSDGKLLFQSTGSGKLQDVLAKVYGLELVKQMLPVGAPDRTEGEAVGAEVLESGGAPAVRVTGYAGAPGLHRGNRSYITLFVNRRWFQDTSIAYAVIQAYHTMLPAGRYPVAVIFVEMDPADVDVNVHPTKAEVRFRDAGAVFGSVQRAVRKVLVAHAPVPQVNLPGAGSSESAWQASTTLPGFSQAGWADRREALLRAGTGPHVRPSGTFPSGSDTGVETASRTDIARSPGAQPVTLPPPPSNGLVPILRVVGQLGATYIVAEGPDGMYLIDQHAAHERILYEQLLAQYGSGELAVQPLLDPLPVDFSPEQAVVVADNMESLSALGLQIEPFGSGTYLLRSVPAILAREGNPQSALVEIVDGLARREDVAEAAREARLVTLICKRAAVKGNTPMNMGEMQELVRRLEACYSPRTCPHGRPTMIYVSGADLARQFGRT
jgi:DNA mismatch repair protein MutL